MGTVIRYDQAAWKTMLMLKNSISWYAAESRDNDKYGTATRKEKALLREVMKEGFQEAA